MKQTSGKVMESKIGHSIVTVEQDHEKNQSAMKIRSTKVTVNKSISLNLIPAFLFLVQMTQFLFHIPLSPIAGVIVFLLHSD